MKNDFSDFISLLRLYIVDSRLVLNSSKLMWIIYWFEPNADTRDECLVKMICALV